ncbi:MAG: Rne/Rng family ribonuclease [Lentisphaeria bacterium]|jgi:ribonuclease G
MKQILINAGGLETRVAVVSDGKLEEYFIERRDEDRLVGSIFKGRINNLEPSLQAAFVDIGFEKNAFLHYWDMIPATQDMLEGDEEHREEEAAAPEPEPPAAAGTAAPARKQTLLDMLKQMLFAGPGPEPATATAAPQPPPGGRNQPQRRNRRQPQPQQRRKPRQQVTVEDIPSLFKPGTEVLVQVTKGPISTKGPRVTTNLSLPGRYLVLLPGSSHLGISKRIESNEERQRLRRILRALPLPSNMGIICRTVGAGKSEKAFQRDLANLLSYWKQAEEKNRLRAPACVYQEPDVIECTVRDCLTEDVNEIVTDSKAVYDLVQGLVQRFAREEKVEVRHYNQPKPLFQKYNLTDQIDSIFSRRVTLPSGGYLVVDETEALIAIDVNSGRNRSGKDHPETILNTNLEAVQEIARQLRLRNVGGLIVLDFIDMRGRKDQQAVYRALKDALLADRARTKVLPVSGLGLVEMTRQRERESLQDAVYEDCPYCSGRGLVKSPQSVSVEIQRRLQEILRRYRGNMQVRVTVHPRIFDRLKKEDADLIKAMEAETHCEFSFRADGTLHMEEFKVHDLISGDEL